MSEPSPGDRRCAWCPRPIPAGARRDAKFCSTRCRQASHRFGKGRRRRVADGRPRRFAYADPPYPTMARRYYRHHPDYAGEVDHRLLVARLEAEYPDGWALSTSAAALRDVLALCPPGARVAAWFRGERPAAAYAPLVAWEPVIVCGGREFLAAPADRRVDALVHHSRARTTDAHRVVGAKPAEFCWWLFELLGALPGDDLVDLFPGSGGVARAWAIYQGPDARRLASRPGRRDPSAPPGGHASPGDGDDPSGEYSRGASSVDRGLQLAAR